MWSKHLKSRILMALKKNNIGVEELILQFLSEPDPKLAALDWLCKKLIEAEVYNRVGEIKHEHSVEQGSCRTRAGIKLSLAHYYFKHSSCYCQSLVSYAETVVYISPRINIAYFLSFFHLYLGVDQSSQNPFYLRKDRNTF